MNFTDPNNDSRRRTVETGAIPGDTDAQPSVVFDAHSTVGKRYQGEARSYSNISPADARVLALDLLRKAGEAEGRSMERPPAEIAPAWWSGPAPSRRPDPVRRELTRALREEQSR